MYAFLTGTLQQGTPDSLTMLIAGYAAIGVVGLVYVIILVVRQRNLQRDIETLDVLTRDEE